MAHILVIDDDELVRRVIRRMLEGAGHTVTEAGDGIEGIERQRHDQVDLVLVDECMPCKTGLETIRELRKEWSELKIIIMSGEGVTDATIHKEPIRVQADLALIKPFRWHDLQQAVDSLLP